jgi:hypothetical protein
VRLGAWLLSKERITEEQLTRALQDKAFYGGRLGTSLIKLGFINEEVLGEFLSHASGIRYAPWERMENVPAGVIATVPARLAAQYRIIPIAVEGRRLHLAMRDPRDLIALDEIAFLTGLAIEPYVATEFRILQALERHYQVTLETKATIPVTGGAPPRVAPPAPPTEAAPPSPPESQLGLDGRPIDAPAGPVELNAQPGPPRAGGQYPTSMAAWREIQEDLPDSLPEPLRAVAPPAAAPPKAAPAPPVAAPLPAAPVPSAAAPVAAAPETAVVAALQQRAAMPSPGQATMPLPAPLEHAAAEPAATMEGLAERLHSAETRDEIFDALLEFTSCKFRRCALFVVQQGRVVGWSGRGDGIDPGRIRNVTVDFDLPSLFIFFRTGGDYYFGPVPELPANARFYRDLGYSPPARVLLMPLKIKERPAVILYADNHRDPAATPEIPVLRRALHKASLALEILILKSKIAMV